MSGRDFALGRPGPAAVPIPDASLLGPDPEPVGCRFEALALPPRRRPQGIPRTLAAAPRRAGARAH